MSLNCISKRRIWRTSDCQVIASLQDDRDQPVVKVNQLEPQPLAVLDSGYRTAGAFGSMEEALPRIAVDLPDVVLIDIGLPGMSGTDGIRYLRERHPNLQMLVLTVYEDDERIFEAMCAGACGYFAEKGAADPSCGEYPRSG